jgi:hypothetical protein
VYDENVYNQSAAPKQPVGLTATTAADDRVRDFLATMPSPSI